MGSVTPLDFLDQILYRLSFELKDIHMLKKHSYTLIALCCTGQYTQCLVVSLVLFYHNT